VALENLHLERRARGCDLKMLITGRPAAASTSTCARSSKRSQVSSLIQRNCDRLPRYIAKRRERLSSSAPQLDNDVAHGFTLSRDRGRRNTLTRLRPPSGWISTQMRDRTQSRSSGAEAMHTIACRCCNCSSSGHARHWLAQVGVRIRPQQRALDSTPVRVVAFC